ncbi:mas-related G-protein coupled receptor member B2-like [Grammomys surdaster]|uniref:mas-related G-protein coupled receptor member B2-like n=1 Tax=Grammomys surdaster TaxID=491861 RepID=UPI0010A03B64|nr:mas-related G-protein coupled receptor member B2-like [Grammomys surdaster]
MEGRNSTGDFLSKDISISTLETNIRAFNGPNDTSYCDIKFQTMILLSLITSLFGMVLNAIVLWLLGFQMHRNAFLVYILNLAVADFLFLFSQFVYCVLVIIYTIDSISIDMISFLTFMPTFPYLLGLSIITTISVERCLSVMWPIWYHCKCPRHTSAVICVLLWALSLVFTFLDGKTYYLLFPYLRFSWTFTFETLEIIITVWTILLFVVLCGSSLILLVRIFCGSQRIPVTRLYVTIALTVLFFLIFDLPFGIYWLLDQWIDRYCYIYDEIIFLSCINSCANPIIYFLVGSITNHSSFKMKTLKLFLERAMQDTPEEKEGVESGS